MDIDQLLALGFDCCGGQLDYKQKNYGFLAKDGPVLTPEGQALVAELTAEAPPKRGRPRKTAVEPVVDVANE